jgi:hypothetical protein
MVKRRMYSIKEDNDGQKSLLGSSRLVGAYAT